MSSSTRLSALVSFFLSSLIACNAGTPKAIPAPAVDAQLSNAKGEQTAVFSGGCFWGVQAVFERVKGVISATSGYAGGEVKNPDYELVSTGTTGHAESVQVKYDPSQITYGQLLQVFFSVAHDPTELNRQGPDEGTQYRSAVFYTNDEQKKVIDAYVAQMEKDKTFSHKIVTQVAQLKAFYPAEGYHQQYFDHHPESLYIVYNDKPKVEALKKDFPELYREPAQTSAKK
jgi:peptide-methionine (S)-S-oxide reductase